MYATPDLDLDLVLLLKGTFSLFYGKNVIGCCISNKEILCLLASYRSLCVGFNTVTILSYCLSPDLLTLSRQIPSHHLPPSPSLRAIFEVAGVVLTSRRERVIGG